VIEFRDLVVSYAGARLNAVDGVSFVSARGKLTALAGPNGSGKSSIVKALLRRADIPRGSATIDGRDVRSLSYAELARNVAVVPQREETTFPIQVREYVFLGRYPHLGLWRAPSKEDELAVDEALSQAGVEELAGRDTDALSGGEWQRVRIALHAPLVEEFWVAPIETVSESEEGFERVYQGSQILAIWHPPLTTQKSWSTRLVWRIEAF